MNHHDLKIKRLEKAFHQVLSEALHFHVRDPRLKDRPITISRVQLNRELTKVSVFFLIVYEDETALIDAPIRNKVIKALYASAPYLLSVIAERIRLKRLPTLRFFYDARTEKAHRVIDLIDQIRLSEKKNSLL